MSIKWTKWKSTDYDYMYEAYASGLEWSEIALLLGRTEPSVKKYFSKLPELAAQAKLARKAAGHPKPSSAKPVVIDALIEAPDPSETPSHWAALAIGVAAGFTLSAIASIVLVGVML